MRIRALAACCLMLGIPVGLPATEYDKQAFIVAEALKLQGAWELDSEETAGETTRHPKAERQSVLVLTVQATRFDMTIRSIKIDGLPLRVDRGQLKLAPPAKGAIDFLSSRGEKRERAGIYELDGDELKLCLSPPG